jgi:Winged helix DNA-binding domain
MMASVPTGPAAADVLARRFSAQLLSGPPAHSPVEVVGRLLAVQGQDPRAARLAIRSRSAGLTAADVAAALTTDRSLLITWLNRGTLHLIRSEDYWLLHRLTVRPQHETACRRNLASAGVTADQADKGVAVITAALADEGPRTRLQIRARLTSAGLDGNGALHLLMLTCQRGVAVRGPMIGAQHGYALVRDWLGQPPVTRDRDADLAELTRRYLAGHGPASDRDLAKWAGLPLGAARRGLSGIAKELRERPDGMAELAAGAGAGTLPGAKLLGGFDPVLLGWESRADILGPHQQIVTVNGLFRPFALVGGKAAGIWSWAGGAVALEAFGELTADASAALAAEASDVGRFLGAEGE